MSLEDTAAEFLMLRDQKAVLEKRLDALKKPLSLYLATEGEADDKGHMWGSVGGRTFQHQRRVSIGLDMEAAEELLKARGLWEECTTTAVVLDEAAIYSAAWRDALSNSDLDRIYPKTVSWSLVVPKVS